MFCNRKLNEQCTNEHTSPSPKCLFPQVLPARTKTVSRWPHLTSRRLSRSQAVAPQQISRRPLSPSPFSSARSAPLRPAPLRPAPLCPAPLRPAPTSDRSPTPAGAPRATRRAAAVPGPRRQRSGDRCPAPARSLTQAAGSLDPGSSTPQATSRPRSQRTSTNEKSPPLAGATCPPPRAGPRSTRHVPRATCLVPMPANCLDPSHADAEPAPLPPHVRVGPGKRRRCRQAVYCTARHGTAQSRHESRTAPTPPKLLQTPPNSAS